MNEFENNPSELAEISRREEREFRMRGIKRAAAGNSLNCEETRLIHSVILVHPLPDDACTNTGFFTSNPPSDSENLFFSFFSSNRA